MAEWVSRPSSSGGLSVAPTSVSVRRGSVLGAAKPLRPASEANLELDAIRISSSRGACACARARVFEWMYTVYWFVAGCGPNR